MFLIFRWNISFNTSLVNKVQIPCGLVKTLLKCSPLSVRTEGRVSPQTWCAMTDGDSTRVPVYSMYKTATDSARGHPTNQCFPSSWSLSFPVDWKKLTDMYIHRPHQQQTGALKHLPSLRNTDYVCDYILFSRRCIAHSNLFTAMFFIYLDSH